MNTNILDGLREIAQLKGMTELIAYMGKPGAYSEMACLAYAPLMEPLACQTFEDTFAAVVEGRAALGMIPIENSTAGRVADVHALLPESPLHVVGEHHQPVVHHLLGLPAAEIADVKEAYAHIQSLMQCRKWLLARHILPVRHLDNGAAAQEISEQQDKSKAAIASERAGQLYGLKSLAVNIADQPNNTTRFLILSRTPSVPSPDEGLCVTTMMFRVRSVPAALYKALGGFATNGVNITKIESYLVDGQFTAARFHLDVEGHPAQTPLKNALAELNFFAQEVRILGTYLASPFRLAHHDC
ncbi:MAG: prephenate dehydratase [Alphaproteobacteria bacterium]|nr:prephenate dehydratase [Alphaproteobacteria bacterium]